jgi:hypothetical protein
VDLDTTRWSGDGDFTIQLVERLKAFDEIAALRVEDAPSSNAGAGYNFLANEVFVAFGADTRRVRRWRFLPLTRSVAEPRLTLAGLAARLAATEGIGEPDYADEGMLQYLRTERVVQPFQTRGHKLVELVRIYDVGRGIPRDG